MNEALIQSELLTALETWGTNSFAAQVRYVEISPSDVPDAWALWKSRRPVLALEIQQRSKWIRASERRALAATVTQDFSLPGYESDWQVLTCTGLISTYNFWCRLEQTSKWHFCLLKKHIVICLSLSRNKKSSGMRQQYKDVLSLPYCEMIIGYTVSFVIVMLALRHFLATWEEIYMAGEGVYFSSLLNAAISFSARPSRQYWRSFESCIIYNSDLDETLLGRFVWKKAFSRHWSS